MSRPTIFTAEATKAYWGGIMAFLAQTQVAMSAHSYTSITELTQNDWITIAMGTLAAFGVVYGVTNAPKPLPDFLYDK